MEDLARDPRSTGGVKRDGRTRWGNIHYSPHSALHHYSPHSALHTEATRTGQPPGQDGHDLGNVLDDPNFLDTHESHGHRSSHDRHSFDYDRSNTSSDGIDPPQAHNQK